MKKVIANPDVLGVQLNPKPENQKILYCTIDVDSSDPAEDKLNTQLVFDVIAFDRMWGNRFYVGCRGARFLIALNELTMTNATPIDAIDFEHTESVEDEIGSKNTLSPEIKAKVGPTEVSGKGPTVENSALHKESDAAKFKITHHKLARVDGENGVKWEFREKEVKIAIRHYLYGNLLLWSKFKNENRNAKGEIRFSSISVGLFREDGIEDNRVLSIPRLILLWRRDAFSLNKFGIDHSANIDLVGDYHV